jgi:hypothetical protein
MLLTTAYIMGHQELTCCVRHQKGYSRLNVFNFESPALVLSGSDLSIAILS